MVAKVEIVERLGESAVLLPALIEEGLAANDRLKIRLTMLQEAAAQASSPSRATPSLDRERRSVGLADPAFNETVSAARPIDANAFLAPGAELLASGIARDLEAMMAPIEIAHADVAAPLEARLAATVAALPSFKGDCVAHAEVARLASAAARRERQPASPGDGLAQGAEPRRGGGGGRGNRWRARLRSERRRSGARARLHARPPSHGSACLRPSGTGHDRRPRRRPPHHPERHRRDRRACARRSTSRT